MIKDDGDVIHFNNPKVQASLASNTFAITGHCETKCMSFLLSFFFRSSWKRNKQKLPFFIKSNDQFLKNKILYSTSKQLWQSCCQQSSAT